MTCFVYGRDEEIATLVARIQGTEQSFGRCRTVGVTDDKGRFLAGVVFHSWNPETGIIQISVGALSPRWYGRKTMNRIADFGFVECGCQMLLVYVREDNEAALRVLAGAGFSFTRVLRLFGRDQDGVIATL